MDFHLFDRKNRKSSSKLTKWDAGKEEVFYKAAGKQILGDGKFIEKVERKLEKLNKPLKKPSLKAILRAVEEVIYITEGEIYHAVEERM